MQHQCSLYSSRTWNVHRYISVLIQQFYAKGNYDDKNRIFKNIIRGNNLTPITCKEASTTIVRLVNTKDIIHATEPKKALVHLCRKLATESKDEEGMKRVAVADLYFLGKRRLRSFVTPLTESCSNGGALFASRREVEQRMV